MICNLLCRADGDEVDSLGNEIPAQEKMKMRNFSCIVVLTLVKHTIMAVSLKGVHCTVNIYDIASRHCNQLESCPREGCENI